MRATTAAIILELAFRAASYETAPFLTAKQKRAIFYDNAARFLRISPAAARPPSSAP